MSKEKLNLIELKIGNELYNMLKENKKNNKYTINKNCNFYFK